MFGGMRQEVQRRCLGEAREGLSEGVSGEEEGLRFGKPSKGGSRGRNSSIHGEIGKEVVEGATARTI